MSEDISNTFLRGIQVLECLFENDFQGKTEADISKQTGVPLTTVWRMLKTLKVAGWAIDVPVDGSKTRVWKVNGKNLVAIAFQFKKSALSQIHTIEKEFSDIAGEGLRND